VFIISNLNKNKTSAAGNFIPRTVMSNLVTKEFSYNVQDGELIEEFYTPDTLKAAGKEKYLDSFSMVDKQTVLSTNTSEEDYAPLVIVSEDGMAVKPMMIGSNPASESVASQRDKIVYYTVQKGDVVSTIARNFDITVNTILWANNLSAYSLIRPGDSLTILPYSGVIHTVKSGDTISRISQLYGVEDEKILSSNNIGGILKIGDKIIVPGGSKLATAVTIAKTANTTGLSIIRNLVKAPASTAAAGAKMVWPTVGHRITQYFSWRHNGVDIANKVGTPIYAADAGTVEIAANGWSGGYGNTIVINHGGGKKTRYGHLSKLYVRVGNKVEKGENIGLMGSTGNSTGSHLHFEVVINGTRYNPLNYIK